MIPFKTLSISLLTILANDCSEKKAAVSSTSQDEMSVQQPTIQEAEKQATSVVASEKKPDESSKPMAQQTSIQKIQIEEMTRGMRRSVVFTPNSKEVNVNGKISKSNISTSEWTALVNTINEIGLSKMDDYEAPSNDRFRDAALISTITVTDNNASYSSQQFDSGRPPAALSSLYSKLTKDFGSEVKMRK